MYIHVFIPTVIYICNGNPHETLLVFAWQFLQISCWLNKHSGMWPLPLFHRYLALYAYKPQKADELELRKGEMYRVTEKCQDGWFKGTSLRTAASGVFPGNYVTPVSRSVSSGSIIGTMESFCGECGGGGVSLGTLQHPDRSRSPWQRAAPAQFLTSSELSWANVAGKEGAVEVFLGHKKHPHLLQLYWLSQVGGLTGTKWWSGSFLSLCIACHFSYAAVISKLCSTPQSFVSFGVVVWSQQRSTISLRPLILSHKGSGCALCVIGVLIFCGNSPAPAEGRIQIWLSSVIYLLLLVMALVFLRTHAASCHKLKPKKWCFGTWVCVGKKNTVSCLLWPLLRTGHCQDLAFIKTTKGIWSHQQQHRLGITYLQGTANLLKLLFSRKKKQVFRVLIRIKKCGWPICPFLKINFWFLKSNLTDLQLEK